MKEEELEDFVEKSSTKGNLGLILSFEVVWSWNYAKVACTHCFMDCFDVDELLMRNY